MPCPLPRRKRKVNSTGCWGLAPWAFKQQYFENTNRIVVSLSYSAKISDTVCSEIFLFTAQHRSLLTGQLLISSHPWLAQTVIIRDHDPAELLCDLWHEHGNRAPVI